jgi:phosphate:Na+ symporter
VTGHLFDVINILGGLALFLYGLEESTSAFASNFGGQSRELMVRFTRRKPMAFVFGVILAAIAQGSTVATSFAIGFVDVGMLTFAGSVVVMMGVSVGGTFVTILLSLNTVAFSPLLLAASLLMTRFGGVTMKRTGYILRGLSLVLLGMFVLQLGVGPLLADPRFGELAARVAKKPVLTGLAALATTGVLQSSSAVMALAVALATAGALPLPAVFPIVMGAHVGSTMMVLLAGLSGKQNARKLGVCTFVYKLSGVLLLIPFLPWIDAFLERTGVSVSGMVVFAQIGLAVFNTIIFYPFTDLLASVSAQIAERTGGERLGSPVYLDEELVEVPSLSILLLSQEMIRLANYMELYCQILFFPEQRRREFEQLPAAIRDLSETCEEYMYRIRISADDEQMRESYATVSYSMLAFRQMARILSGNLKRMDEEGTIALFRREVGEDTWEELSCLASTNIRLALRAFALGDVDSASDTGRYEREFEELDRKIRARLGTEAINRRELSPLIDFLSQIYNLVKTSLEVARGEAYRTGAGDRGSPS